MLKNTNKRDKILLAAFVLFFIYLLSNQFSEMNKLQSATTDFGSIFNAAIALNNGIDPYHATGNAYFYPPVLAMLFGVLTFLPIAGASFLFFCLKILLVVFALKACFQLVGGNRFSDSRKTLFILGLVFVAARFWESDLQYGNTNSLIMALVILAITWDSKGRWLLSGIALALATSIKILPILLVIHFVFHRRWKTVAAFSIALLILNLLPFVWSYDSWLNVWQSYLDAGVVSKLNARLSQPDNQSLWGMINRSFSDVTLSNLRFIWLSCSALLLGLAGWLSYKTRTSSSSVKIAVASLYPLLGLLISPGSWVVHYTAVLLPMAVLWSILLRKDWQGLVPWTLFGVINIIFSASGWSRFTVNAAINYSLFVIAVIILFSCIFWWANPLNSKRS